LIPAAAQATAFFPRYGFRVGLERNFFPIATERRADCVENGLEMTWIEQAWRATAKIDRVDDLVFRLAGWNASRCKQRIAIQDFRLDGGGVRSVLSADTTPVWKLQ